MEAERLLLNHMRKSNQGFFIVISVFLLIFSGIGYRVFAHRFHEFLDAPIAFSQPLSSFPMIVGDWEGSDWPIPTATEEYMKERFADAYVNRVYTNKITNEWVNAYVVFCGAQPSRILGHKPERCYPGSGWVHDETKPSSLLLSNNRTISCLMHRFHNSALEEIFVLNFYILNGQITIEESGFSSILGRRPNISGDPARYVVQVQISSVLESSVREAAAEMTGLILDFFPADN